jgi:hypothetical protein
MRNQNTIQSSTFDYHSSVDVSLYFFNNSMSRLYLSKRLHKTKFFSIVLDDLGVGDVTKSQS